MRTARFQRMIRNFYQHHGRHDLPWRKLPRSLPVGRRAYRILVSEVMLQQTQVSRVLVKYPQFLRAFPTLAALDRAPLGDVLRAWQGMGYNRRPLCLKRLARRIMREYGGRIPADPDALERLPGIGPATAGAIAAFAFNRPAVFLETNIRRVYIHFFFPHRRRIHDREILTKIEATLPSQDYREWYYALMDYGALALKSVENPNRRSAAHARQPAFAGSDRALRGRILSIMLSGGRVAPAALEPRAPGRVRVILRKLIAEGLLSRRGRRITVSAAP